MNITIRQEDQEINIIIREEEEKDYETIYELVKDAFQGEVLSNHDEHILVNNLRKSPYYIKELALVAEVEGEILGYILFTKIQINSQIARQTENPTLLALAPVAVHPKFQKKGIGANLINAGERIATNLNYPGCIVLGHDSYYPRFGYIEAAKYQIYPDFSVPSQNFMAKEFVKDGFKNISGTVVYPEVFFGGK